MGYNQQQKQDIKSKKQSSKSSFSISKQRSRSVDTRFKSIRLFLNSNSAIKNNDLKDTELTGANKNKALNLTEPLNGTTNENLKKNF